MGAARRARARLVFNLSWDWRWSRQLNPRCRSARLAAAAFPRPACALQVLICAGTQAFYAGFKLDIKNWIKKMEWPVSM
jgi:hypothetical protein